MRNARTWLTAWAATSLRASDCKQATQDLDACMVRVHLVPALDHVRQDRLRPSDVEGLVVATRAQWLAGSTIRTMYTVMRTALDDAVRDGLVQRNVATVVKQLQPRLLRARSQGRAPGRDPAMVSQDTTAVGAVGGVSSEEAVPRLREHRL